MTVTTKPAKPLGRKAYGSIGHIASSRLGPGDHHVHEGQSDICVGEPRHDKQVFVQTKLDGSCVAAGLTYDGELVALGRAGYLARTSKYEMHHMWADWVDQNAKLFRSALQPGERIVGEWLAQAHGTRYDLGWRDPFVAFDLMSGNVRTPTMEFYGRVPFEKPDMIPGPMDPEVAITKLDSYGAEQPEGVVYRVESNNRVEFLAKWVRPDKEDGCLLDLDVWNWRPW